MNLTMEVRDGIVHHTGSKNPFTLEGQIVHLADRIAYINHDIDDALRSGVIRFEDLPDSSIELFGASHRSRINSLVIDVIKNSEGKEKICQSPAFKSEMDNLRKFMFTNVYKNVRVKRDEDLDKVETVIKSLYEYYLENPNLLPEELKEISERDGVAEAVKDYIAGMTDRFALSTYTDIFVPKGWK